MSIGAFKKSVVLTKPWGGAKPPSKQTKITAQKQIGPTAASKSLGRAYSSVKLRPMSAEDIQANFKAYDALMGHYDAAKGSLDPAANVAFVKKAESFLQQLHKLKVPIDSAVVCEMLGMFSYLNFSAPAKLSVRVSDSATPFFPSGAKVQLSLVGQHISRLDMESIAKLPWDTYPPTSHQLWSANDRGKVSYVVNIRGTASRGPGADQKSDELVVSGAPNNSAPVAVAHNSDREIIKNIEQKYPSIFESVRLLIGHSQGAAVAEGMLAKLSARGLEPHGYFLAAPGMGEPAPASYPAQKAYYARSKHDLVPRSGRYTWPGKELAPDWFSLPMQRGYQNQNADRMLQHGSPIALLMSLRGTPLEFLPREASGGGLLATVKEWGRRNLAGAAFTPRPVEENMVLAEQAGVERYFPRRSASDARGTEYAFFIHLTTCLQQSEWVGARFLANPDAVLHAIASLSAEIIAHPKQGLEALQKKLDGIESPIFVLNDTAELGGEIDGLIKEARRLKAQLGP